MYARSLEKGVVIGLGSKGESGEANSSYLGELKGACWALENTKCIMQGQQLIFFTNIESVYIKITRKIVDPKRTLMYGLVRC